MNALVPMTDQELRLSMARERLRRPEEHAAHELRAACATLLTWGDWLDGQRAQALLDRLEQEETWVEVELCATEPEEAEIAAVERQEIARLFAEAERRLAEAHGRGGALAWARELAKDFFDLAVMLVLLFGGLLLARGFGWTP